jgi:hypothetical protein
MLPGNSIPLFEIPIYLMSKKAYRNKWAERHTQMALEDARGSSPLDLTV